MPSRLTMNDWMLRKRVSALAMKCFDQQSNAVHASTIMLEAWHLSKSYQMEEQSHLVARLLVLDNITLHIASGEVLALLGPSGSGKSTLLRLLAGQLTPTRGQVLFRGEMLHGPDPHVALFPSAALLPCLTVQQQVELALPMHMFSRLQRQERALAAIKMLGLDDVAHLSLRHLSAEMHQRVGLARALVGEPELLWLDEPFSIRDIPAGMRLRHELLSLWHTQKMAARAMVIATHQIDEALSVADRLLVLGTHPGRLCVDLQGLLREKRHPQDENYRTMVHLISRLLRDG